jgi:flagellar motor switch protein FliG
VDRQSRLRSLEVLSEQGNTVKDSHDQLRKAALLIRSVDGDTAAALLAQLSPEEAVAVREAMRSLGPIDSDEQASLLDELRLSSSSATKRLDHGVELSLSGVMHGDGDQAAANVATSVPAATTGIKRFEFLENAPIRNLVPYLTREHAQTVAVVLSHLEPSRAAAVLAELPQKRQADVLERLSTLGEADAETVRVLEHELAAWMKLRADCSGSRARCKDAVASILSAADTKTRERIVTNLKSQSAALAEQLLPKQTAQDTTASRRVAAEPRTAKPTPGPDTYQVVSQRILAPCPLPRALRPAPPLKSIAFDDLICLDNRALARLLQTADPNVLALALAGSREDLVDRICDQMPKRMAKTFRRELRKLGPTRLSDVEAAQRVVAELASRQMAERRPTFAGAPVH